MKRIDCFNDTNQFGMTDQLETAPPGQTEDTPSPTPCLAAEGVACGPGQMTEETRSFSPGPTFPPSAVSTKAQTSTGGGGVSGNSPTPIYVASPTPPTVAGPEVGMQPCGKSASGQLYYKDK
jgi:hypothetical protein